MRDRVFNARRVLVLHDVLFFFLFGFLFEFFDERLHGSRSGREAMSSCAEQVTCRPCSSSLGGTSEYK